MEITWKKIALQDKEEIGSYYKKMPVRNCEFTFANNYLWAPFYQIRWGVVKERLVFLSGEGTFSVSFPQGDTPLGPVVEALLAYFEELGKAFRMHLVSPEQFRELEALYPGKFEIVYDRDKADYVYEREKLLTLSGKKLHGKRNHINKFKGNYPDWSYEPVTAENEEECLELAKRWRILNGCEEDEEKSEELCVTMNALQMREELDLRGGLIRAGGRVVAFSLGEPCGEDMFVVHIEKAYPDVQGAYPMINQQFVEHETEGFPYINREEDTGAEGLRRAKLSYYPVFMMEKGTVTVRQQF